MDIDGYNAPSLRFVVVPPVSFKNGWPNGMQLARLVPRTHAVSRKKIEVSAEMKRQDLKIRGS